MLKIYLQIFGTIAVCLIIFLNYNVFIKKPNQERLQEIRKELKTLERSNNTLDKVLKFRPHFPILANLQKNDYDEAGVFFADEFNEPKFMGRLQKLVDLSGCTNNGIKVGRITKVSKPAQYADFVTKQKNEIEKSVESFLTTMGKYYSDSKKQQQIEGPDSRYSSRLMFYQEMSAGKKFPRTLMKGMEVHRFNMTLRGSYTACKKFLWLVSENRPYAQATVLGFAPVSKELQGPVKKFTLRVVIQTYVDKNGKMEIPERSDAQG